MDNEITSWEPGTSFKNAYEQFHPVLRKKIYARIMEWCEWSKYTFYAKKNGIHELRPLEAKIIDLIFQDYGVNAWSGKEIEKTNV